MLAPATIIAELYERADRLPHFDPDRDREPLPLEVINLRAALRSADG